MLFFYREENPMKIRYRTFLIAAIAGLLGATGASAQESYFEREKRLREEHANGGWKSSGLEETRRIARNSTHEAHEVWAAVADNTVYTPEAQRMAKSNGDTGHESVKPEETRRISGSPAQKNQITPPDTGEYSYAGDVTPHRAEIREHKSSKGL